MDAKELFSAAIRVIGLLSAARGFNDLLYFFMIYTGIKTLSVTAELPYTELYYGLFYFFAGLYLLRGAPLVVDYAFPYREIDIDKKTEQETTEDIENL